MAKLIKLDISETNNYLATKPGRFVFTPTYGLWLNMIESFLVKLHVKCPKEELAERIYQYFDEINEEPIVFHWKYKINEISSECLY